MRRRYKRRRSRVRLNPTPFLVLFLIGNCIAGILYSPLTHLRRVRVLGAEGYDQQRIESVINEAGGLAWLKIPVAKLESDLQSLPEVKTARIQRNLFGRALVRMEYRRPVAGVVGNRNAAMDEQGVLYATHQSLAGLPAVDPPPYALGANLAFAGIWPAGKVAEVCKVIAGDNTLKGSVVQVDGTGRLCLNREGSGQIVLGDMEGIGNKLEELHRLLADSPGLLSEVKQLNLTDPKHPVRVDLPVQKQGRS